MSLVEEDLRGYWRTDEGGLTRVFTFRASDGHHEDLAGLSHTYEILGAQRGGYRVIEGRLVTHATADLQGLGSEGYTFSNQILSFHSGGTMILAVDTDGDLQADGERRYVRSEECPRTPDFAGALREHLGDGTFPPGNFTGTASVAIDDEGNVHAIAQRVGEETQIDGTTAAPAIWFASTKNTCGSRAHPIAIALPSPIRMDDHGNLHVVGVEPTSQTIIHLESPPFDNVLTFPAWEREEIGVANSVFAPSLEIDEHGEPVALVWDGSQYSVRRREVGIWTTEPLLQEDGAPIAFDRADFIGTFPRMALLSSGRAVVVWGTTVAWQTSTGAFLSEDVPGSSYDGNTDVAVDGEDRVHVLHSSSLPSDASLGEGGLGPFVTLVNLVDHVATIPGAWTTITVGPGWYPRSTTDPEGRVVIVDSLFKSTSITTGWFRISADLAGDFSVERRVLLGGGPVEGNGGSPEPWKLPVLSAGTGGAFVAAGDGALAVWRGRDSVSPRPRTHISVTQLGSGGGEVSVAGESQDCNDNCRFNGFVGDLVEVTARPDATSAVQHVTPCTRFLADVCLAQIWPSGDGSVSLEVSFEYTPLVEITPLIVGPGTLQLNKAVQGGDNSVFVHGSFGGGPFSGTTARISESGALLWSSSLHPSLGLPLIAPGDDLLVAGVVAAGTDVGTGPFDTPHAVLSTLSQNDGRLLDVRSVPIDFQSLRAAAAAKNGTALFGVAALSTQYFTDSSIAAGDDIVVALDAEGSSSWVTSLGPYSDVSTPLHLTTTDENVLVARRVLANSVSGEWVLKLHGLSLSAGNSQWQLEWPGAKIVATHAKGEEIFLWAALSPGSSVMLGDTPLESGAPLPDGGGPVNGFVARIDADSGTVRAGTAITIGEFDRAFVDVLDSGDIALSASSDSGSLYITVLDGGGDVAPRAQHIWSGTGAFAGNGRINLAGTAVAGNDLLLWATLQGTVDLDRGPIITDGNDLYRLRYRSP